MSEPPAPPQVSPDGKFYWDGQRWVPIQQVPIQPPAMQTRAATSHRGRNIGCLAVIVGIVIIAVLGANGSRNQPTLKWTVDGRAIHESSVGGTDAVQVTVTNNGTDASNFIVYLNAKDDWFKHHVITDPGGCSINKNLERLECGPLKAGETKTINIGGSPKDAGNFDFASDAADEEGSTLLYPSLGEITWSETVTP